MLLDAPNHVVARALIEAALDENAMHTPAGLVFHKPDIEAVEVTALPQPREYVITDPSELVHSMMEGPSDPDDEELATNTTWNKVVTPLHTWVTECESIYDGENFQKSMHTVPLDKVNCEVVSFTADTVTQPVSEAHAALVVLVIVDAKIL
jgi:hypothetical protein